MKLIQGFIELTIQWLNILLCINTLLCLSQEKWDSMTRKWKDNCLLQLVRLFLIDEASEFVSHHKVNNFLKQWSSI